ncbi:MAG: cobalt ECF transporter T component CbiQ, partial [Methanobacteriaceae archaeon]|nr:cobalt ECF transporter T component CbiQ [Methanobacteriaceae archaeon]
MHISIDNIELESGKDSIIHRIDGRIKFLISLLIIIYAVYTTDLLILYIMEIYLLILILLSKISLTYTLKRMLLILPFGGFIALFQLFI